MEPGGSSDAPVGGSLSFWSSKQNKSTLRFSRSFLINNKQLCRPWLFSPTREPQQVFSKIVWIKAHRFTRGSAGPHISQRLRWDPQDWASICSLTRLLPAHRGLRRDWRDCAVQLAWDSRDKMFLSLTPTFGHDVSWADWGQVWLQAQSGEVCAVPSRTCTAFATSDVWGRFDSG